MVHKTSVALDEELLNEVRQELGTTTIRDTIDAALREVLRRKARREEIDALTTLDGLDLDDPEILANAWR